MQKTRKSIAKRFKKTGTGKLLRRTPGHRHLLRNKSVKQRRRAGSSNCAERAASYAVCLCENTQKLLIY